MVQNESPGWETLKQHVYREDGSLRDIFIDDTGVVDWRRWADFVNREYRVTSLHADDAPKPRIDMEAVQRHWAGERTVDISAVVFLGDIELRTYFVDSTFIENDITPSDIRQPADHDNLLRYLKDVSILLGKPVLLTQENPRDASETLLTVSGGEVRYSWREA